MPGRDVRGDDEGRAVQASAKARHLKHQGMGESEEIKA
jgi:hypothetical protein